MRLSEPSGVRTHVHAQPCVLVAAHRSGHNYMSAKAPYRELDRNIVRLCRALNEFPGIQTIGSCGGHEDPKPYQQPAGSWVVLFTVRHDEHGWHALEFLTWVVSDFARAGHVTRLTPHSSPPFLNRPGATLYFAIDVAGIEADEFAERLLRLKRDYYIPPRIANGSGR